MNLSNVIPHLKPFHLPSLFPIYYFVLQKFDYAIWTGDVPPHNIWNQSRADQVKCLEGCLIVNNLCFQTHAVSFLSMMRKK